MYWYKRQITVKCTPHCAVYCTAYYLALHCAVTDVLILHWFAMHCIVHFTQSTLLHFSLDCTLHYTTLYSVHSTQSTSLHFSLNTVFPHTVHYIHYSPHHSLDGEIEDTCYLSQPWQVENHRQNLGNWSCKTDLKIGWKPIFFWYLCFPALWPKFIFWPGSWRLKVFSFLLVLRLVSTSSGRHQVITQVCGHK